MKTLLDQTCVGLLGLGLAASLFAQGTTTPAPQTDAAREAASSAERKEAKTEAEPQDRKPGAPSRAVGFGSKQPMDIRLRDGGVKMPKCVEESREGLACK